MKNMTIIGVFAGLLLAIAISVGGFSGLLWSIVLGAIGGAVGAHFEGHIDLRQISEGIFSGRGGRG